jgi:hypothetical protein
MTAAVAQYPTPSQTKSHEFEYIAQAAAEIDRYERTQFLLLSIAFPIGVPALAAALLWRKRR